jgi:hypothetical protein
MRRGIAQKLCKFLLDTDSTMTAAQRALYEAHPMWMFYSDKEYPLTCRRTFGVMHVPGGTDRLHMVSCMLYWYNEVVGGVPCDDKVVALSEWTPQHKAKIQMNVVGDVARDTMASSFLDPLGFLVHVKSHAR